jgi:hypothetical protein
VLVGKVVAGAELAVAGAELAVAGAELAVAGAELAVAGAELAVAGTGVVVAGTGVVVAGTGVVVAGTGVVVAGTGVVVAGTGVVVAAYWLAACRCRASVDRNVGIATANNTAGIDRTEHTMPPIARPLPPIHGRSRVLTKATIAMTSAGTNKSGTMSEQIPRTNPQVARELRSGLGGTGPGGPMT